MSFFFDARFIRVDHHDGISRFSSELFQAISRQTKVIALISDQAQLDSLPPGTDHELVNDPKNPFLELLLPRKLNKLGASVVFSPMQTMGSIGKKYKLVLTLHDLIYYKHRKPPGFLAWTIRVAWRVFHLSYAPVRILLNRADAVVTISETTKELIVANQLTKRPVHVIYNASSMPAVSSAKKQPRTRNLLYMGSFMPYKNVELLVNSMDQLPGYTLTLCSKVEPERKKQLLSKASHEAKSRIHFVDGVSESKYLELLDSSFALVSASKDEGFGIPVIEAMSRSLPVVVSSIPIFHEVAGEAGVFFNPESSVEFAEAVQSLETSAHWQEASARSLSRSTSFDWHQSANKLLSLIESIRR